VTPLRGAAMRRWLVANPGQSVVGEFGGGCATIRWSAARACFERREGSEWLPHVHVPDSAEFVPSEGGEW